MDERRGIFQIFIATIFFAIMPVLVKIIPNHVDGFFVSLVRFITGTVFVLIMLKILKVPLRIYDKKAWILRGFFGSLSMILYYISIVITSSGRATVLASTYPVFTGVFGFMFFKEKITWTNVMSLILCIIGSIYIFYDGTSYLNYGDLIALLSSITGGIAMCYIKKASEKNNSYIVYLSACLIGILFTFFSVKQFAQINYISIVVLILVGLTAFIGQILFVNGLKYVSALKGGIINYASIPMTIFLSYFIGEEFKLKFFIGTVCIIIGLVLEIYRGKNKFIK
jgi:drug/metabolite transporter (DMT)-like permease